MFRFKPRSNRTLYVSQQQQVKPFNEMSAATFVKKQIPNFTCSDTHNTKVWHHETHVWMKANLSKIILVKTMSAIFGNSEITMAAWWNLGYSAYNISYCHKAFQFLYYRPQISTKHFFRISWYNYSIELYAC